MKPQRSGAFGHPVWTALLPGLAIATLLLPGTRAIADGEVTVVTVTTEAASPLRYTAEGSTYLWGVANNQILESFAYRGGTYTEMARAAEVRLRRVDLPQAIGEPCGVFAENTGNVTELVPDYPARLGNSDNCDMGAMLGGRIVNRGALNVFSNVGPDPKNVERIDYLFPTGIVAPLSSAALARSGHLVAEKRGNNPIRVAAITALDANGEPAAYGPLVSVGAAGCAAGQICYGVTQLEHRYSFLQNASTGPQGFVTFRDGATERLAMALVTSDRLGLATGQRYFGFSFFANDVDAAQHDLVRPDTFPRDTADNFIRPGDGADFYGGVSGWYVQQGLADGGAGSLLSGAVFVDLNQNGALDANEAAIDAATVSLIADSNANGLFDPGLDTVVAATESAVDGGFSFVGVPPGLYFIQLDAQDPDIPPGLQLPAGSNPIVVNVTSGDQSGLNFTFLAPLGDGTRPVAVADAATSPQDQAITVPVLANDIDPVGSGLTLVSASGAQNGTLTLVGAQVQYTPNPGFIGTDSFVYVMQDGIAQQATGTVSVTMLRFSDINNNGIDDYIECGCTDIRLIAGVDGVGLGGLGVGFLVVAVIGVRLRRRPRFGDRS
ncbi:MAG: Ig-like domain-containing protein [Pseudomonadota bacterium]